MTVRPTTTLEFCANDSRETRARASEIKFLIDPATAERVREWARAHLSADEHGSGPWGDTYDISSLYFDTADLDVLMRRGSYGRAKYRVRRYGHEPVVFLERKLRTKMLLAKRRTRIEIEDLVRVDDVLDASSPAWPGEWFRRRLEQRQLLPVCQVAYRRVARLAQGELGAARMTIDEHLRAAPIAGMHFSPAPGRPILDHHAILELKFRLAMPAPFKQMVEKFALSPAAISKYRLAQTALGIQDAIGPLAAAGRPAADVICA